MPDVIAIKRRQLSGRQLILALLIGNQTELAEVVGETDGTGKTELIIEQEDFFWTRQLEIPEGGDFPALERIEDRPNLLAEVFEPRRSSAGTQ